MYQPTQFQEQRIPVMHDLMRTYPFASLVSYGRDGLAADQEGVAKGLKEEATTSTLQMADLIPRQ